MKFSDEMINAYADGELLGSEKTEFENALQNDVELQQVLNNVHLLKAQLREAYKEVELPAQEISQPVNYRIASYVALLFFAFAGGWIGGGQMHGSASALQKTAQLMQDTTAVVDAGGRYILHIGTNDHDKFKRTLDEAEALLANYRGNNRSIELEVIANAGGLDLFLENASPYVQRVRHLSSQYPNIKFIACENAIKRLKERGVEASLINTVHRGETALDQVVKRMNEGWTYIKI